MALIKPVARVGWPHVPDVLDDNDLCWGLNKAILSLCMNTHPCTRTDRVHSFHSPFLIKLLSQSIYCHGNWGEKREDDAGLLSPALCQRPSVSRTSMCLRKHIMFRFHAYNHSFMVQCATSGLAKTHKINIYIGKNLTPKNNFIVRKICMAWVLLEPWDSKVPFS